MEAQAMRRPGEEDGVRKRHPPKTSLAFNQKRKMKEKKKKEKLARKVDRLAKEEGQRKRNPTLKMTQSITKHFR